MVAEAAGLGAAIDYLSDIGMEEIRNHEIDLTDYTLQSLISEHSEKPYQSLDLKIHRTWWGYLFYLRWRSPP